MRSGQLRVDIGVLASLVCGGIQAGHRAGRMLQPDVAGEDAYGVAVHGDRAADVPDRDMGLRLVAPVVRDLALEPDLAVAGGCRLRAAGRKRSARPAAEPEGERSGGVVALKLSAVSYQLRVLI